MTTSTGTTRLIFALSLFTLAAACRDDSPAPANTGGTGASTGGRGGTGGTGGRGGTGGTGGSGGRGGTGGTGGSASDAPVDSPMVLDTGMTDLNSEAGSPGDGRDGTADMSDAGDTAPTPDTSGDTGPNPVTFFVTSIGSGVMGGNLGGLTGADAKCEALAAAVGAGGRGWKAFLSAEAGAITPAVNAKDRIGAGPWHNQRGQMIAANVAALIATPPAAGLMRDEKGGTIPTDWHEVLTGSQADGTLYVGRTCSSWTTTTGQAQSGIATDAPSERFSSHASGCTQAALEASGNQGRFYCFASTP
jgi:hypothetical protein